MELCKSSDWLKDLEHTYSDLMTSVKNLSSHLFGEHL
jgi:hypothetical protein